jgi:hypothetical protein
MISDANLLLCPGMSRYGHRSRDSGMTTNNSLERTRERWVPSSNVCTRAAQLNR